MEFTERDYKSILKKHIAENQGTRGYQTRLADAAGCQKAYLSQVLHSSVHLSPDHAAGLCAYWQYNEHEAEYFMELVHLARASSPAYRGMIERRLQALRKKHQRVANRLPSAERLSKEFEIEYYSTWRLPAIHAMAALPGFRGPAAIAERMRVSIQQAEADLRALEKMGLLERTGSGWAPTKKRIHLPRESRMAAINHASWRNKTVSRLQESSAEDALHFSAVYVLSKKDIRRIKNVLLAALESTEKILIPSPEEDVVFLGMDLFRVD